MTELSTDYMEGALPLRRRMQVRVHLALCSFCRRHYDQLRATIGLLGRMPPAPVPPSVEDAVVAKAERGDG